MNHVLEVGIGSGVVLVSALQLGAVQATGIDLEQAAIDATKALLVREGLSAKAQLACGDMWSTDAVQGQKYDFVISNLPQFACERVPEDGHLPSWSAGGLDGRRVVDAFLTGLPEHLAQNGLAVITHNIFLDLIKTQVLLSRSGLLARVAHSVSIPLSLEKSQCIHPDVLKCDNGRGVRRVGDCWFVDFDVLEITWESPAPLSYQHLPT